MSPVAFPEAGPEPSMNGTANGPTDTPAKRLRLLLLRISASALQARSRKAGPNAAKKHALARRLHELGYVPTSGLKASAGQNSPLFPRV